MTRPLTNGINENHGIFLTVFNQDALYPIRLAQAQIGDLRSGDLALCSDSTEIGRR